MKKWAIVCCILVISLSYIKNSKASYEGVLLRNFQEDSILKKSFSIKPKQPIENIVYLPEKPFDQKEAAMVISRLSALPETLLQKIALEGIRVRLFEGKLTDNPTASHLKGMIPRGYKSKTTWDDVPGIGGGKVVLVKIGASEKGKGHGSVNLELHELAHSIDRYILYEVKYNRQFLNAWEDERGQLFPGRSYFLLFPEEYFAEAFAMYYYSAETKMLLFLAAPKTYGFIRELGEFNNENWMKNNFGRNIVDLLN